MARVIDKDSLVTVSEHDAANYLRSLHRVREAKRRNESSLVRRDISDVRYLGNVRVQPHPPLRKDARVYSQLQRVANDNTYSYVTNRFHPNVEDALAIMSVYKLKLASQRKVVHHAE